MVFFPGVSNVAREAMAAIAGDELILRPRVTT